MKYQAIFYAGAYWCTLTFFSHITIRTAKSGRKIYQYHCFDFDGNTIIRENDKKFNVREVSLTGYMYCAYYVEKDVTHPATYIIKYEGV